MRAITTLAAVAALTAALPQAAHATAAPITAPGYEFSLIGQHALPGGTRYRGTEIGGVTGVDYDAASGEFRLISGDRSAPRFYTGRLSLSGACPRPALTGVSRLVQADGTAVAADPQALRYDAASRTVLWADRAAPAVGEARRDGSFVARFAGAPTAAGVTGLAATPDGSSFLTASGTPRAEDGDAVRFTLHDRASGEQLVQFAYVPERVPGNGVAEVLAVADSRFLVLEQAGRDSAKLYEVDFAAGATNVADLPALAGSDHLPVAKRLVLDLTRLGLRAVDDLQAVTWGPVLGDGARTLVFVSDNGLDDRERTQFIAVRVRLG